MSSIIKNSKKQKCFSWLRQRIAVSIDKPDYLGIFKPAVYRYLKGLTVIWVGVRAVLVSG